MRGRPERCQHALEKNEYRRGKGEGPASNSEDGCRVRGCGGVYVGRRAPEFEMGGVELR